MTNNDELAMKLKAAAEMATPGEWERGDGKHGGELLVYCDDALGSAVCEATSTYNSIPKLQRIINLTFIATANPANILALLAERDADKKRIAELEASHQKLRESMAAIHNTIRMDGVRAPLEAIMGTAKRAYVESAAAAGIKLEVGE